MNLHFSDASLKGYFVRIGIEHSANHYLATSRDFLARFIFTW